MKNVVKDSAITPRAILVTFLTIQGLCVLVIFADPDRGAEMFQRFGSLVVCASVFFVGMARFSLDSWEKHWLGVAQRNHVFWENMHKRTEQKLADAFGENDPYVQSVRQEHQEFMVSQNPEKLKDEFHAAKTKLMLADMAMLLFGTIQWGFGDLIFCWLVSCEAK